MDNRILLAAEELEALAQTLRSVSSGGEETESRSHVLEMAHVWLELRTMETKVASLQGWRTWVNEKVAALEAGPQSPAITAPSMTPTPEAPSDAEPCSICHLPQESGLHRHPMAPVLEPDSPPECTEAVTPPSSPSGQPTTPRYLVVPTCGCVRVDDPHQLNIHPHVIPTIVPFGFEIRCPFNCGALWLRVLIHAQAVPASPSGST